MVASYFKTVKGTAKAPSEGYATTDHMGNHVVGRGYPDGMFLFFLKCFYLYIYTYIYTHIYVYIYRCVYMYVYILIYM